jgi:hypothetical protein
MIMHYDYTLCKKNSAELLQDTKNWKKNQEIKMIEFLRHNRPLKCHKMFKRRKGICVLKNIFIDNKMLDATFKINLKCYFQNDIEMHFFSSKCLSETFHYFL